MPDRSLMVAAPFLDCVLIADDLTGACDAAVHFAARGRRTVVTLGPLSDAGDAQAIALTTESRDCAPSRIQTSMTAAAASLPLDSVRAIFKKIDSTLRGNTALEIVPALDTFGCDAAVVCPAFPRMNRLVENGYLKVTSDPSFEPIPVGQRFECAHVRTEDLRSAVANRARIVSVDAICDSDLDRVVAEILPLGRTVLWVGSAGLAAALARAMPETNGRRGPPKPARSGPALFCIGSDHAVTLMQQNALIAARGAELIEFSVATRERIGRALAQGRHLILRIPRGGVSLESVREQLAGTAAAALLVSGGDTASLVCHAAGVKSIELYDEVVCGIPRGILRGGDLDGMAVVTKSGGFGDENALIDVADYFA